MSRFKKGQQLVCISKKDWKYHNTNVPSLGPEFGKIVICDGYNPRDQKFIFLEEYNFIGILADDRISYRDNQFMPLADLIEIHELLSAIPQTERV